VAELSKAALGASLGVAVLLSMPLAAFGADPAPVETARPPTCAERFPAEGPAGVDLRLGCIVSEVVGLWRPGQAAAPPTLSAYAIALGVLVAATIGLGLVATRVLARRAGARLAPTIPEAWWVCPACHSINGLAASRCYNCGAPQVADATAAPMLTSHVPSTPQSSGRGKHQ
jgi:hypothetical protein